MIKLQLLLHRPPHCSESLPELDQVLRARVEALGMRITAVGLATISAEMTLEDYEHLFGAPPPTLSSCLHSPTTAPTLPVPPELADAITLITLAVRHLTTGRPA